MRVLIADESRVMRLIVSRTLRQAGYVGVDLVEAANGRDALEAVQAQAVDLVLSEWNLSEMSGLELLRALRAGGSRVPFGFVTTEGSEEMRETALRSGASFLIAKPFTPEAFLDALASHPRTEGQQDASMPTTLPAPMAVRDLVADLLGRDVTIERAVPLEDAALRTATYALYADDRQQLRAAIVLDLPLSASLGAAIALVPAPRAEQAVEDRMLPPDLGENLVEVCNVVSALFNLPGAPHLKLSAVHGPANRPPVAAAEFATRPGPRMDVRVGVQGYGSGTLGIVVA